MHLISSDHGPPLALHDFGGNDVAVPVLLAHATGLHGLVWAPLAAALATRHRVWSWDFRGHGASRPVDGEPFSWEGFGADVLTVLDGLDPELGQRPVGVGHSMGGTALVLAELARPGTFAGLFLYEPIIFPGPSPDAPGFPNPMAASARRRRASFDSRDSAFANYASKPPLSGLDPRALHAYVDHGLIDQPDGTVTLACRREDEARIFEMGGHLATFGRLGELDLAVVVAVGSEQFGPALFEPAVAEAISGARLLSYDDLTHFGPLEQPERVAGDIEAFIASLD